MVVRIAAVLFGAYHIAFVGGFFSMLGIPIYTVHHRAIHLGLVLFLLYLLVPAKTTKTNGVPWYDVLFVVIAIVWNGYLFLFWEALEWQAALIQLPLPVLLLAAMNMVIVFEGTRRLIGPAMPIVAAFFVVYTLTASYFPGFLKAKSFSFERVIVYMGLWADGVYGRLLGMSATMVVMFIIFAQFLRVSGAGEFFINLAYAVMGRFRGGPAKVAVGASALFGTISGSAAANVSSTGVITIPLMKRTGYKPHFAGGVEAVASNGSQLMPPIMGIVAFLMSEFLDIPYWKICVAAAIPAVLYFLALLLMVDLEAARTGLAGLPRERIPRLGKTLKEGWYFFVPLLALVFLLIVLMYSPQKSALYSLGTLVVLGQLKKGQRIGIKTILRGLEDGTRAMLQVACVCALAGVIIGSLNLSGLGTKLASGVVALSGGNMLLLLLLTAVASIIMGMGVTTTGVYVILAVLIAPALIMVGIPPLAAHMFVFWYGMSAMITPPVCPTAYIAAGIADSEPLKTGWTAARLGIVTYIVPFTFIYNPALLTLGAGLPILLACGSAVLGSAALAAGLQGYMLFPVRLAQRPLLLGGAVALIFPGWASDLIGIALLALPCTLQVIKWRRRRKETILERRAQARLVGTESNPQAVPNPDR